MKIADVVSGRAKLEGIHWVLFSAKALRVLTDQLRALLPAGALLGTRHLREVRFKPGRKLSAYYDVLVSTKGGEAYCVRPIQVKWALHDGVDRYEEASELAQIQAEAVRRGVAAPFLRLMGDFPEWSMQVRASPLDTRFTQLVRLSDPRHVRAMLADAGASGNAGSDQHRISDYTVTTIKYRRGRRHVLRYDPVDPEKGRTVFAKLYVGEDGERAYRHENGERAFRVARGVADWLAEHSRGVNCLRPLAYVAEDAVVLCPRLCGVPLSNYVRRPNHDVARRLQQAGAALCTLHHLPVALTGPLGSPRDFAAEVEMVARMSNHTSVLLPEVGSAIEMLLDRAQELHERLPQEPPTFTHGDLKTEHIWVTAGGLTVMDLDSSRLADPAHDLGYFLADWQFQQSTYDQVGVEEIYQSFFAGYAPGAPKERLIRAHLYEAVEFVKCAVRRMPLFEHDWASRTAGLVERAWAVINDLQHTFGLPAGPRCAQRSGNMFHRSSHAASTDTCPPR